MHTSLHYRMSGLGQGGAQMGVAIGTTIGEAVVPIVAKGSVASLLGIQAATAVPIIGAAIAGIGILAGYLISNSGCGPTCVQASEYANKAADLMAKNLNAYFAIAAPRPKSVQLAALQNFDGLWAQLVNLCTNDPMLRNTTAGRNCVLDRQAGACKWQGSGGECWNWFIGFRDPIANDPAVVDDTQVTGTTMRGPLAPPPVGGVALPLIIGIGAFLAYMMATS